MGEGWGWKSGAISQNINYPKLVLGELHHIKTPKKKSYQENPFCSSIQMCKMGLFVYFDGHHNVIQSLGNPQLIWLTNSKSATIRNLGVLVGTVSIFPTKTASNLSCFISFPILCNTFTIPFGTRKRDTFKFVFTLLQSCLDVCLI